MNIRRQYQHEHPERIGETDKEFAESLYTEWLEAKVIAAKNDVSGSLPSDYVCPQCGKDENGSEIHALTHHNFPLYTVEEARKELRSEGNDR